MNKGLKILHVSVVYGNGSGGAALIVDSLCRVLESHGHRNAVLYDQQAGTLPRADRQTLGLPGLCEATLRPDRAKLAGLEAWLDEVQPDIVQFHQVENFHLVRELARRYPSVLYIYNHLLTCPSGTRYWAGPGQLCALTTGPACLLNHYTQRCGSRRPQKVLSNYWKTVQSFQAAQAVGQVVVISDYMKETLVAAGYPAQRVRTIYALTPSILAPAEPTVPPSEENLLLFAGRVTEIKGLEVLIEALPLLKSPWRLAVAGDGYRLPAAQARAGRLGLSDRIEFIRWVPNEGMADLYRRASLVVVPSIYPDPFVLVGIEAMRRGRPVVAFGVGGIPEWLQDGYNGFTCRHLDRADLAAKIDLVLQDPDLAARLGANGKLKAERDFNPTHILSQFEECYAEAIAQYEVVSC